MAWLKGGGKNKGHGVALVPNRRRGSDPLAIPEEVSISGIWRRYVDADLDYICASESDDLIVEREARIRAADNSF